MCVCVFQNIKNDIQGHAVSWYSDVFGLVFKDLDVDRARSLWKKELSPPKKEEKRSKGVEVLSESVAAS